MENHETFNVSDQWVQFVSFVRSRIWTIATFFVVTVLIVMVGTIFQTPKYQATATVLIDTETPSVLTVSTTRDESTVGQNNYITYADYYRTQLEVIRSRSVAQEVFMKLNLQEQTNYAEAKDPVGALIGQITVEPIKQTRLTKVSVEDPDPKKAALIVNEIVKYYVEQNVAKAAGAEAATLMKNEYLKLQSKESELSKRYKAKFPAMVRIRQQMEHLALLIEREKKFQTLNSYYDAQGLDPEIQKEKRAFLKEIEESYLHEGLRPNNIRVQDWAQIPTKPSKPNKKLNLVLAMFFGLIGGLGVAFAEQLIDSSVKSADDIEGDKKFLLLGSIPKFDGLDNDEEPSSEVNSYQYVHNEPQSQAAESYRALRTNLIYATHQSHARTIVVTSPGSGEGKTTTIASLGIVLAQIGLKVLVVEADLRRPRIHKAFESVQQPGLSEYLVGKAGLDQVVHPTNIPGLWTVPSGVLPPNPAELLGLEQMKKFLAEASGRFDRVLIDTPPGMIVTDAVILAAVTGTVLIVAQSGKTPRRALSKLVSILHDVKANILGIVLNNVAPANLPSYYSYSSYGKYNDDNKKNENFKQYSKLVRQSFSNSAKVLESFTRQKLSSKKEKVEAGKS